jgi:hypothetical protein
MADKLPPQIEALVAAERAAADPPDEARERVRARLRQSLGLSMGAAAVTVAATAGTSGGATGKVSAAGAKSLAPLGAKVIVAMLAGAGIGGAGFYVAHSRDSRPAVRPAVIAPPSAPAVAPPTTAVLPMAEPAVAKLARPAPAAAAAANRVRPSVRMGGLAAEQALVGSARVALRDGNAAAALALIERHAHRFPAGQLAEERDSLRVRALAKSGDRIRAQASAQAFARRYPNSLFLSAVRATTSTDEAP